jgi:glycerol-3-phosphate acyltransferase PlsX
MQRIAIDAMGGDHAPGVIVEGAVQAAKEYDVTLTLVGHQEAVKSELARQNSTFPRIELVHASACIEMRASASKALKVRESSLRIAFDLLKRREVEAVVSAGNSGAMLALGMFVLGRLPGVDRPAILAVGPSESGRTVLIDGGANTDCKPRQLVQFATMGSIYAERVLGIDKPRVGLLSNGEEEEKGTDFTRMVAKELRASGLNYVGYAEGRDITSGRVDVVVCDGFTGNVALKTMEGVGRLARNALRNSFRASWVSRLGFVLSRASIREGYGRLDYANYGGAPLIGLDGVAIVAHGGSSAKAIKNAIRVASETASRDVNGSIVAALESTMQKSEPASSVESCVDPGEIPRR